MHNLILIYIYIYMYIYIPLMQSSFLIDKLFNKLIMTDLLRDN